MLKLSERAILVKLRMSSWSGNMRDDEVTSEVITKHRAAKGSGGFNKKLVNSDLLRGVSGAMSRVKAAHRSLSLPWADDARITPTANYQHYSKVMRDGKADIESSVKEMLALYPAYIGSIANKDRLGSMYDPADYPTVEELEKKFGMDLEVTQVPDSADFRAQLSEASVKAVVKDIERRSNERVNAALNDVFERVAKATEHMMERLRAYVPAEAAGTSENRFHDSLIYNVKDLAELLPMLNINGDPRIDKLSQQMLEQLAANSPDVLRVNDKLRESTAAKAEAIFKKVNGYLQ